MKKIFFLLLVVIPLIAFSQKPKIEFENTSHNFGTINEKGGSATCDFIFKNTGTTPLILTNVSAGCGCTTPEWSKQPVLPNESGSIRVAFNPLGRPGAFVKGVTVTSNAESSVVSLTIRGNVSQKPADPYAAYNYSIGKLKAASGTLNLGNINNTQTVEKTIDIVNTGDQPVNVTVTSPAKHLTATTAPATLKKGEKGKITLKYNAGEKKDWGFVSDKLTIVTAPDAKGEIVVVANINEDFSKYKTDASLAPVAELSEPESDLGELEKNATKHHELYIQNNGKSDLMIRKIKTSDESVTATPAKTIVKPGKKVKIDISMKADDKAGKKIKIVSFTTNDPKNTVVSYKVSGTVK